MMSGTMLRPSPKLITDKDGDIMILGDFRMIKGLAWANLKVAPTSLNYIFPRYL